MNDFKTLPLEVAVRDGRARRTTLAALAAASRDWAHAEGAVSGLIRAETGLRSTERRFVGEAVWGIVRKYDSLLRLAERVSPGADPEKLRLLIYFLYLTIEKSLPPEMAVAPLAEAGVSTNSSTAPSTWTTLWKTLCTEGTPVEQLATCYGLPLWIAEKLNRQYGTRAGALADALNQRAPIDLRVNLAQANRETLLAKLHKDGVVCTPTPGSPWGVRLEGHANVNALPGYRAGLFDVQDEGSQRLVQALDVHPGDRVADVCAGGGGKLAAMVPLAGPTGKVVAMDAEAGRLKAAVERLTRLRMKPVDTLVLPRTDAWKTPALAKHTGRYDRVLVDAPCSGTGAWRRHPADRLRLKESDLGSICAAQRDILMTGAMLVKPGGFLLYATCSILKEENEDQAAWLDQAMKGFEFVPNLAGTGNRFLVLLPNLTGTDGFFAAGWVRRF